MRLDKFIADLTLDSRSEIKKNIKNKHVLVNGEIVCEAKWQIDETVDVVTYFGERLTYRKYIYLMMNKPSGYLSATQDVKDACVVDLLPSEYLPYHLFPVGRLDKGAQGLLLLTNDGDLAHRLTAPKHKVAKTYLVHTNIPMTSQDIITFSNPMDLGDFTSLPAKLELTDDPLLALVTVMEGKFHQVKRMVAYCGKEVTFLKRLKMGNLTLDENLKVGEYRELTTDEIEKVKQI